MKKGELYKYDLGARMALVVHDWQYGRQCAEIGPETRYFDATLTSNNVTEVMVQILKRRSGDRFLRRRMV